MLKQAGPGEQAFFAAALGGISIIGLAILLAFHLLGIILKDLLSLPLPANVIGLALFICALFLGWIKLEWVETAAEFLIKHMLLFFLPFVVGSMVIFRYTGTQELIPAAAALVVSTVAALLVTGWFLRMWERKKSQTADTGHG